MGMWFEILPSCFIIGGLFVGGCVANGLKNKAMYGTVRRFSLKILINKWKIWHKIELFDFQSYQRDVIKRHDYLAWKRDQMHSDKHPWAYWIPHGFAYSSHGLEAYDKLDEKK